VVPKSNATKTSSHRMYSLSCQIKKIARDAAFEVTVYGGANSMFSAVGNSRWKKTLNVVSPEKAPHSRRTNKSMRYGLSKNPVSK
jgi:hypothetical protein